MTSLPISVAVVTNLSVTVLLLCLVTLMKATVIVVASEVLLCTFGWN